MVDALKEFGKSVHEARLKQKLSQEELAFKAGLHRTYISEIERGIRNVSLKNIKKISGALNLSISEIVKTIK